ncbi:MAG: 2-C-methyl-D-erythritol 4-phosphate cytidylyltransferase [Planctomycetota bacterium]
MPKPPDTVALLLAAGRSTRMGGATQKTLLTVAGRAVALRSAEALLGAPSVRGLIVVARPEDRAALEAALRPVAARILAWADGGPERVDSVRAGVAAAPRDASVLLVHDAARCLVRSARVEEVARAAAREGAAVLAVRVRDTIKRARDGAHVDETLPRAELWAAATPQGARAALLRAALDAAARDSFMPTDDVALIERYPSLGARVVLVEDDDDNLKLTSPADVVIAEALLAQRAVHGQEQ